MLLEHLVKIQNLKMKYSNNEATRDSTHDFSSAWPSYVRPPTATDIFSLLDIIYLFPASFLLPFRFLPFVFIQTT